MFQVLIADDEIKIRSGLKKIVDWENLGYHIAGEAGTGKETLTFLCQKNPDVALMDIRMPGLSGLDAIRTARKNGFSGKIIILSGYSDFKYAQEAISLGVEHYLTKPINELELERILLKLKEQLSEEAAQRRMRKHYMKHAHETALRDLLLGSSALYPGAFEKESHNTGKYQVVLYSKYFSQQEHQPVPFDKLLQIDNSECCFFESFSIDNVEAILLKGNYPIQRFADFVEGRLEDEGHRLLSSSPLNLAFITFGRITDSLAEIHSSYEDANWLLSRRFFCAQNQHIIGYGQFSSAAAIPCSLDNSLLLEYRDRFLKHMQNFNRAALSNTLQELGELLRSSNYPVNDIRYFLTDLFLHTKEAVKNLYRTTDIPFPLNSWSMDFIQNRHYLFEILRFFSEQFELVMNCIGNNSRDSMIDNILQYINHNYMHNLKLETIAPLFGYDNSYLGKIFKQKTNSSFNTYLDMVRIEHSRQLLEQSDLKVYEIAEKVGYTSVDYFYLKFRKYMGEKPSEYRKRIRRNHDDWET